MENTHREYVARRKAAMVRAGVTQRDLMRRWDCSRSMANHIVLGTERSYDKETDFAELVGRKHSYLFVEAEYVRGGRPGVPTG